MPSPTPVNSVLHAIGQTPLVRLQRLVGPGMAEVVVKLEYFNPTGSYKDRMALAMIEGAEKRGTLKPGMQVIEYTGGSTGSSLAGAVRSLQGADRGAESGSQHLLDRSVQQVATRGLLRSSHPPRHS